MIIDRILNDDQLSMVAKEIEGYKDQAQKLEKSGAGQLAADYSALFAPRIEELKAKVRRYVFLKSGSLPALPQAGQDPGTFLVEMRIARKLTQVQLAGRLAVVQSTVAKYEAREYGGCPSEVIVKVANALDLKVTQGSHVFDFASPMPAAVVAGKT